MIDRLLDFLTGRAEATSDAGESNLESAVAALLIEAARMDDAFDAGERTAIEQLLARHFGLDAAGVQSLVERAEREVRRSTQYFPFTREICQRASEAERLQIIEMLWAVAYSDGTLDPDEDALIRQIAGLIQVSDQERGAARQRALAKLAAATPPSWGPRQ
ncbi:TerB family tellurite resistance protein [Reyranella sp.]|uniref:tellurite resistance TerB family protein n=1 Tax=Reyranella sp. TaxID=1929291 RepID=UPI003BA9667A